MNNYYLDCTMILRINILTTATLWGKYIECKLLSQVHKFLNLVPYLARTLTWPVPAPVARGHHRPLSTATCPIRGLCDPAMMNLE